MSLRSELCKDTVRTLAFVNVADPALVEIAGHVGFDAVILDAEHGPLCMHDLVDLIRAAEAVDCHATVRVPSPNRDWILRSLDAGARGVLVPQIDTARDAAAVVRECRYPPVGQRGAGFYARHYRYAIDRGKPALRRSDDSVCAGIQIESVEAVAAAREIIGTTGLDYVFVGPTDLSVSYGSCEVDDPWVKESLRTIAEVCSDLGVPSGVYAANPQAAQKYIEMGYRSVAIGLLPLLTATATAFVREIRDTLESIR